MEQIKNPFIADHYFETNPTHILGEQVIETGRYGSEFIKVNGTMADVLMIDVPVLEAAIENTSNLSHASIESAISETIENEKEILIKPKVKRPKKEKESKASEIPRQETYTIRETSDMYNTNIDRKELEAYFFTKQGLKGYDHSQYFDEYTHNKEAFIRDGLIAAIYSLDANAFKWEYVYIYKSGNISKRISWHKQFKEQFISELGEDQYGKQLKWLEESKPKSKGFVGEDKIILLPHSNFAREITVEEIQSNIELNGQTNLLNAFIEWLRYIPPSEFKKSNSSEIIMYYLQNKTIGVDRKGSKEEQERQEKAAINIRQRTKEEGDELFSKFLNEEILPEDQVKIEQLWNEKYNSIAEADLTKIPIGFRISKTFKDNAPLRLSATQRQAVAFMMEKKSGLLAYGVGVGKTLSSIACISQAIDNGLSQYPLIIVPTNTYYKWMGDIQGYTDKDTNKYMQGALPHLPKIIGLYNLNAEIVRNEIKEYTEQENKTLTSLEYLLEAIRQFKDDDIDKDKVKDALSKLYKINWVGLHEAYREYTEGSKSVRSFTQFISQYFKDELNYKIYELGKIKSFPAGTIFVTTEQGIQKLGIRPENQAGLTSDLYTILSQGESSADEKSDRDVAKLQLKIEQTIASSLKRAKLYIEDFGFDFLCFDESHYYKKVFTYVKGSIKGTEEDRDGNKKYKRDKSKYELKSGSVPSSRALSAFVLSHAIQRLNDNRNVLHLTATPFTNSPLEIYSILALTNYKLLEEMDMANMVDFFDTFMKINYDIRYTAQKTVVKDIVLTGFNNLNSLRGLIYSLIDKKDEGANLVRPDKYVFPSVEKGIETTFPMTLEQDEIIRDIKKFIQDPGYSYAELCRSAISEEVGEMDFEGMSDEQLVNMYNQVLQREEELILEDDLTEVQRADITNKIKAVKFGVAFAETDLTETESKGARILQALSAMRQVTLSPYTWNCKRSPELKKGLTYTKYIQSSPKLQYVMGCIKSVLDYHKENKTKPSGQVIYMNAGVDFFPLIKDYLVKEIGLSEAQVGMVTGGMSKGAKENVKRAFLNGDILVLIGSATISVGVDLQNNSSVLYNCYYDWNPTDAQQIEGRIWRQGNKYSAIRIVYPMCYNSVDPVMFQYLQEKTSRINEIWNREGKVSELDLRDFNPKQLQKDLITDPEEKADWEILEESEKVESEIIYLENRLSSIEDAQQSVMLMEEQRPDVAEYLTEISSKKAQFKKKEALDAYGEKRDSIIDKYANDEAKMASELSKLKKSTYDSNRDIDGKYKPQSFINATDEELYIEAKKVAEWLSKLTYSSSDILGDMYYEKERKINLLKSFRGNFKDYKQLVDRVLKPLGLDIKNISNPVTEVKKKLDEKREQLTALKDSKPDRIARIKQEMSTRKFNITIEDRVKEFAKYNYLLDLQLPESVLPRITIEDKLTKFKSMLLKHTIEEKLYNFKSLLEESFEYGGKVCGCKH